MGAKLYVVAASHPCFAVKRALELKGIPFKRVEWPPTLHVPLQRLRFSQGTVPGLVLDGERMIGSRTIMHRLDELRPEPPLYPSEPEARRMVEEADIWGEEVLQALARRMTWWTLAATECDHLIRRGLPAAIAGLRGRRNGAADRPNRVADQRCQRPESEAGPGGAPAPSRQSRQMDRGGHDGLRESRTRPICRSARASRCSTPLPTCGLCSRADPA